MTTKNDHGWPRHPVRNVETRKRDLVLRISDWTRDKDEPAYDVEVYARGVYGFNLSASCTVQQYKTRKAAKAAAVQFAQQQIARLL